MREPTRDRQVTLELVKSLNILGEKMHWLSALTSGYWVVDRGNQRNLLIDEIKVEVHKVEERLQFANSRGKRPVGEHAQLRRIRRHASGGNDVSHKSTCSQNNLHFTGFSLSPASRMRSRTSRKSFTCSDRRLEKTITSSRYAKQIRPIRHCSTLIISLSR